jgi:hypothetical protein
MTEEPVEIFPEEIEEAAEICSRYELSEEAKPLLKEGMVPQAFLAVLQDHGLLADAVAYVTHAIPKRRAVWWAAQCVRRGAREPFAPKDAAALDAAEKWAVEPTEGRRRLAEKAAADLEYGTLPAALAAAAFFSSGSVSLPDAPIVPPKENLTAGTIVTAVNAAAAKAKPEDGVPAEQARYIELLLDLDKTAEAWADIAQILADEHATAGRTGEPKRLKEAAVAEAGRTPAAVTDARMETEIERVMGPKRAEEKAKAEQIDKMKEDIKKAEELKKKAEKKMKT